MDARLPVNSDLIHCIVQKQSASDILATFNKDLQEYTDVVIEDCNRNHMQMTSVSIKTLVERDMYNRLYCAAAQFNHDELINQLITLKRAVGFAPPFKHNEPSVSITYIHVHACWLKCVY